MALPGQILAPTTFTSALGPGTHISGPNLIASIAGPISKSTKPSKISINRPSGPLLPVVGTITLGRITRILPRQATISILSLGPTGSEHVCSDPFPGLIRQQDIRATEIDKVVVGEMFRVGDIVRAEVISLGDERSYYLSTARNELGVVMARCESTGGEMVPISWREFEDLETGVREGRKVAKPV